MHFFGICAVSSSQSLNSGRGHVFSPDTITKKPNVDLCIAVKSQNTGQTFGCLPGFACFFYGDS